MRRIPFAKAVLLVPIGWAAGCASAPKAAPAAPEPVAAAPAQTQAAAPVLSTPAPAEVGVQVRETRAACGKDAVKQGLEVIDFVEFNRLDESNWDATIRARRKGKIVRVGCRYDMRQGWTYVYEPAKVDGGNPWGNVGSAGGTLGATPVGSAPVGSAPAGSSAATSARSTNPPAATSGAPRSSGAPAAGTTPPKSAPTSPATPGSNINLGAVADSSARSGISRTRDACLAEAARRKISFEDFDAFRRVETGVWETQLVLKKGRKETRACRLDLATGKATIK